MKKLVYSIVILLAIGQLTCQEAKAMEKSIIQPRSFEIDGFAAPESIINNGEYYYVSNVGVNPDPTAKDGNGFITKVSRKGIIIEKQFIINVHAPKGMAIIKNILYVTDIDKVLGFDLKTKKKKFDLKITGTEFLNDLTVMDDQTLIVSATDINKLFQINIKKVNYTELKSNVRIKGPNGVWVDQNNLYVCGRGTNNKPNGEVGVIDLKTGQYKVLADYFGKLDGLVLIDKSTLFFSNWVNGTVNKMTISNGQVKSLDMLKINGPADFYYDNETGKLWIPKMMENKVLVKTVN